MFNNSKISGVYKKFKKEICINILEIRSHLATTNIRRIIYSVNISCSLKQSIIPNTYHIQTTYNLITIIPKSYFSHTTTRLQ